MSQKKKRQESEHVGYIKVDRDPQRQASALRQFFPGTGVNVRTPPERQGEKESSGRE